MRPERSRTWNAGVRQELASGRAKVSAEYFHNDFYDIVSFSVVPPPAGSACFFFGNFFNTDEARAQGTNVSVETKPLRWLTVVGNYSYDDTRVLKSPNSTDPALIAGSRLIRRPTHSGSLILNGSFRRLTANLAAYFTAARTDSDFLSFRSGGACFGPCLSRNPGYARFDLATSYNAGGGVTTYIRVANILDREYQDAIGYPALGREVRVGMQYRFAGRN